MLQEQLEHIHMRLIDHSLLSRKEVASNVMDMILQGTVSRECVELDCLSLMRRSLEFLLQLHNPLVNKILQVVAASVERRQLCIYITSPQDMLELNPASRCHGFYSRNGQVAALDGIIVLSARSNTDDFLGTLMHEMVHAVCDIIGMKFLGQQNFQDLFMAEVCPVPSKRNEGTMFGYQPMFQRKRRLRGPALLCKNRVSQGVYTPISEGYTAYEQQGEYLPFYLQTYISAVSEDFKRWSSTGSFELSLFGGHKALPIEGDFERLGCVTMMRFLYQVPTLSQKLIKERLMPALEKYHRRMEAAMSNSVSRLALMDYGIYDGCFDAKPRINNSYSYGA